jgi:hypothetical protein
VFGHELERRLENGALLVVIAFGESDALAAHELLRDPCHPRERRRRAVLALTSREWYVAFHRSPQR